MTNMLRGIVIGLVLGILIGMMLAEEQRREQASQTPKLDAPKETVKPRAPRKRATKPAE